MVDQTYTLEKCDCNEALLEGGYVLYLFSFFRIHRVGNAMVPGPGRSKRDNCGGHSQ